MSKFAAARGVRRAAQMLMTLGAVTALVSGCGGGDGGETAGGDASTAKGANQTPITFRLEWVPSGYHAPFYLAQQEGLWKKRGLDVTIKEGNGSADAIKTLIAGAAPIVISDRSTGALSASQGADVLSVFGMVNKGALAFSCAPDANVTNPQDLKGKTILTTLSGSDGALLPSVLKANGLDESDMTIQNVDTAAKTSLLLAGKGDCATFVSYVQPPVVEARGFKVNNLLWADAGLNVIGNGLETTKAWAKEHPDELRDFLAGVQEAYQQTIDDPQKAVEAFMKSVPDQDRQVVEGQLKASLVNLDADSGDPIGYQTPDSWKSTIDALVQADQIQKPLADDAYYTNEYLPGGSK